MKYLFVHSFRWLCLHNQFLPFFIGNPYCFSALLKGPLKQFGSYCQGIFKYILLWFCSTCCPNLSQMPLTNHDTVVCDLKQIIRNLYARSSHQIITPAVEGCYICSCANRIFFFWKSNSLFIMFFILFLRQEQVYI